MLVPFDRNLLHISGINGRYIPSVLNDTMRFEQIAGGILLCAAPDRTGYVLFKQDKPLFLSAFLHEGGQDMLRNVPFYTIVDSTSLDIYVNLVEDPAIIEHLFAFFNMPIFYASPFELSDVERNISYIQAEKITGILGLRQGSVLNTAVFDKGEFLYLTYYHPGTKSYAFDKNPASLRNYVNKSGKLKPYIIVKKFRNEIQRKSDRKEMILLQNDPIVSMMLCYIDVFEIIIKVLKDKLPHEKLVEFLNSIFDTLREKYSPLFSSISFSAESGSVNWNQMFDERRYVSLEYRFDHYHLYLDELLKLLLKSSRALLGDSVINAIASRIKNYMAMMDIKDRDTKEIVRRFEKILNKLTDR